MFFDDVKVKVFKTRKMAKIPSRAHKTDAVLLSRDARRHGHPTRAECSTSNWNQNGGTYWMHASDYEQVWRRQQETARHRCVCCR